MCGNPMLGGLGQDACGTVRHELFQLGYIRRSRDDTALNLSKRFSDLQRRVVSESPRWSRCHEKSMKNCCNWKMEYAINTLYLSR